MNINCNRSPMLPLRRLAQMFQVFWVLPYMFGCFFQHGFLRRFLGTFLFALIAAQAHAVTNFSGSISLDTTWTASSGPYVLSSVVGVASGVTLTIEPGTVIKGNGANAILVVEGTLHAQGTAIASITFTSILDDSAGGDTNNDGSATTAGSGNWVGLQFASTATDNLLDHVVVRYASSDYNAGRSAIFIATSGLTRQNSTITVLGHEQRGSVGRRH